MAGSKLFYNAQRHPSASVASESSGRTRPQTEPGRTRTPKISEGVKNLTRHRVRDVVTGSDETRTDKKETEEGWVVVEKSTSDTVMPFDSYDEGNVLVPSPDKGSEQTNKILENEKLAETTKLHFTNKFGSTFKVLPESRDKSESVESRGAAEKVLVPTLLFITKKTISVTDMINIPFLPANIKHTWCWIYLGCVTFLCVKSFVKSGESHY